MEQNRAHYLSQFKHCLDKEAALPSTEMIAGLFPRGYMSIVASMAGAGKTWLMEYLACQLSVGGQILKGLVPSSKPMKTLIFSGETGYEMLNKRLAQTNWQYNVENITIYCAIELGLNNVDYMLNSEEGKKNVYTICLMETPDIIFFDTLISFHTAEENKQGDMTAIYTFLRKIAKQLNCAVVLNHHTRKRPTKETGRKFTQEDVIGTSSGVRVANAVYIVTSNCEDDEEGKSIQTVENVKAWEERVPPFSYKFTKTFDGYTDFEINLDIRERWSIKKRVRDLLRGSAIGTYYTANQIANAIGIDDPDLARYHADWLAENENLCSIKYIAGQKMYQIGDC